MNLLAKISALIATLGLLSGCAKAKFSADKAALLKGTNVMGGPGTASGQVTQPGGGGGNSSGQLPQPVPVAFRCADKYAETNTTYKEALAKNLPMDFRVNGITCTTDQKKIVDIVSAKSFTVQQLGEICSQLLLPRNNKYELFINGTSLGDSGYKLEIYYAYNELTTPEYNVADENCTQRSSPLVVHLASDPLNPMPIALSSQKNGIYFDLLGKMNSHRKVRISWFTNDEYRLLALPNARGEVKGIDQLFGNATLGPDGKFSDDGYQALSKHDSNADQRIDKADPVYWNLRLWHDANFNGRSDAGELVSLDRAHVEYVDLVYSDAYSETDEHGNQTKMKSVVGFSDGSLELIFDLWFSYR